MTTQTTHFPRPSIVEDLARVRYYAGEYMSCEVIQVGPDSWILRPFGLKNREIAKGFMSYAALRFYINEHQNRTFKHKAA